MNYCLFHNFMNMLQNNSYKEEEECVQTHKFMNMLPNNSYKEEEECVQTQFSRPNLHSEKWVVCWRRVVHIRGH